MMPLVPERNVTYVAFHADGTSDPLMNDMKFLTQMKSWANRGQDNFALIQINDKVTAAADPTKRDALKAVMGQGLEKARNLVLLVGAGTRKDADWVPLEIAKAIDEHKLPIIVAYTDYAAVTDPTKLRDLWPEALAQRIDDNKARVMHVPFRKEPLITAMRQVAPDNLPKSGTSHYGRDAYIGWGLML